MATDYKNKFESINLLLLADSYAAAQAALHGLLGNKLPREQLAQAANLARRARWPEKAVALLHQIVRPERGRIARAAASDFEKAEFGAALRAIGALNEAVEILSGVNHVRFPRAGVYLGIAHIVRWDAEPAVAVLERAVHSSRARQFENTLGRVYLGIALSYTGQQSERVEQLLSEVLAATASANQRLVHQAALEALVMHHITRRAYAKATSQLDMLDRVSQSDGDPVFRLLVAQWRSVIKLGLGSDEALARRQLAKVRQSFRTANQWERARSCDYYAAMARDDQKLLRELFFSSCYPGFRRRLRGVLEVASNDTLATEYRWQVPALEAGGLVGPKSVIELEQPGFGARMNERVLQALSSDTYKSFRVAELHELLYPGESFNPHSSPARIHQNLLRTRQWLAKKKIPARIVESDGYFCVRATAPLTLVLGKVLSQGSETRSRGEVRVSGCVALLAEAYPNAEFSAAQAARILGESARSARRHLGLAREEGLVTQLGSGRGARYRIGQTPA